MKMLCDSFIKNLASLGSPGMNEIRWLKPLFPNQKFLWKGYDYKKNQVNQNLTLAV